jgi:hypothetical protein
MVFDGRWRVSTLYLPRLTQILTWLGKRLLPCSCFGLSALAVSLRRYGTDQVGRSEHS